MTLIGLVGTKGVGKDTVGDYLTGYTKRAFATPIKEACAILFNVPITSFEGELKEVPIKKHKMSPRQMLQLVGTDMFREKVHAKFWIRHFQDWYALHGVDRNVVVTDVRFQNEVDAIKALGGVVVRILRPESNGGQPTTDTHITEKGVAELRGVNYWINNETTIERLHKQIDNLIDYITS